MIFACFGWRVGSHVRPDPPRQPKIASRNTVFSFFFFFRAPSSRGRRGKNKTGEPQRPQKYNTVFLRPLRFPTLTLTAFVILTNLCSGSAFPAIHFITSRAFSYLPFSTGIFVYRILHASVRPSVRPFDIFSFFFFSPLDIEIIVI